MRLIQLLADSIEAFLSLARVMTFAPLLQRHQYCQRNLVVQYWLAAVVRTDRESGSLQSWSSYWSVDTPLIFYFSTARNSAKVENLVADTPLFHGLASKQTAKIWIELRERQQFS